MAEDLTNVYDIHYLSPPSLKHLVCISLALDLWRHKINKYRATNSLIKLELVKKISPSTLKPLVPSTIFKDIEKYTKNIGESIEHWLEYRCLAILDFHRDDHNEILHDFDDFVCDFDGGIHCRRTAKRMMLCDRFSIDEKFKIACDHCLEEDVVKFWSSVSARVNLDGIDFFRHPLLYYWICRLTDQLEKILQFGFNENIEEVMLRNTRKSHWTIKEYFWNRLDPANRWSSISFLSRQNDWEFSRYMLAKLDEQELDKYMTERGNELLPILLKFPTDLLGILPTWKLIKNKLTVEAFLNIAREIFKQEADSDCVIRVWDASISWEIWKGTPYNVKQDVIREVLPDTSLFVRINTIKKSRIVSFLLAVLSDASFEERSNFWHKNWSTLIFGCKTEDLSSLMDLCFNDESEIIQFKESTLSKYENIRPQGSRLLEDACFDELKKFMKFCCSSEQACRDLTLELVNNDLEVNALHMLKAELFDEFIKDLFNNDEDEIRNFKIKLSSLLDTNESVRITVVLGQFRNLMKFIDRFVVSKKRAVYLKKRYFPDIVRRQLVSGRIPMINEDDDLPQFMQWCFENNEREIAKFKATLHLNEFIGKIIQNEVSNAEVPRRSNPRRKSYPKCFYKLLSNLLDWCLAGVDSEAVEKLKTQCAEVFESLVSQQENKMNVE